jgi:hypothetical protein
MKDGIYIYETNFDYNRIERIWNYNGIFLYCELQQKTFKCIITRKYKYQIDFI